MTEQTKSTPPCWDLSDLYENSQSSEISSDLKDADTRARRFQKLFMGKVVTIEARLLGSAIKEYEDIQETLGKLGSYAGLLYAENISDEESARFYQNISEKVNNISTYLLFFELEINKISDEDLEYKTGQCPDLERYLPWLRDVRVMRPYMLSDEVEKILHEKSLTSRQSWHRLFEETIASMRFEVDGKQLTCAKVLNNLSSSDPAMRKSSAKAIGDGLGKNIRIFSHITNTLAKDKEMEDKWRGFSEPISSRNLANLIEDDVTNALISTVKNNYEKTSHRYYKIKAKWFGKNHLDYWDRNAPLPAENDKKIPWNQAKNIVLDAYENFSPEMAEIGRKFFDNGWIDANIRDGKDSGAFSHPTVPSVHPYILMNYQGKTRDVMTLAHELGHGVHQVLSASQGPLMADTPLTLAETASVFGEQLTFRSLLEGQKDDHMRKILIAGKIEDMLNTVVRQIAFCEFERQVHHGRKKGELSSDQIGEIWMNVQQESLGPAIKFSKEYKYYWAYIPHFVHTPFYVYAYAFGDCLVNSLYKTYQETPEGFVDKYIDMLKAGGTLRHKELLSPFGLDASNPDFWQGGMNIISEFIDQIE